MSAVISVNVVFNRIILKLVIHHSEVCVRDKCEDIDLKLELSAARVQTFVFPGKGIDIDLYIITHYLYINAISF